MPAAYGPFTYSPIVRRPPFRFPNGARVAVWVIPNVEFFPLRDAIPPIVGAGGNIPDVPSWGIRDYGNRIGIFRVMEVLDRCGVRGTAALNSDICHHHPQIVEECRARDWEFIGHNETNTVRLNGVPAEEEAQLIARTVETIAEHTGARLRGWLSAGLQETWNSLGHLCDAGLEYVADWCNDDQPFVMKLPDRRQLACVPYSFEINDKIAYEVQRLTPEEFSSAARRQFDVLYREGETQARVLPIALHPYISGVAYRVKAISDILEHVCGHHSVWLATGSEIAAAARDL